MIIVLSPRSHFFLLPLLLCDFFPFPFIRFTSSSPSPPTLFPRTLHLNLSSTRFTGQSRRGFFFLEAWKRMQRIAFLSQLPHTNITALLEHPFYEGVSGRKTAVRINTLTGTDLCIWSPVRLLWVESPRSTQKIIKLDLIIKRTRKQEEEAVGGHGRKGQRWTKKGGCQKHDDERTRLWDALSPNRRRRLATSRSRRGTNVPRKASIRWFTTMCSRRRD